MSSDLYLPGLCDSAPESLTMSFPRNYNPSSARREGIVAKSSPEGLHDLGLVHLATPYGNPARAYDAERTLCDALRGTSSPDLQLVSPAFRSYLSSGERNLPKAAGVSPQLMLQNYKFGRRSTLSEHQGPDPHAIRTNRALGFLF